jgi:hypothetical protein
MRNVAIAPARFTATELFERCDRALYLSKKSVRNRTIAEIDLGEDIGIEPIAAA